MKKKEEEKASVYLLPQRERVARKTKAGTGCLFSFMLLCLPPLFSGRPVRLPFCVQRKIGGALSPNYALAQKGEEEGTKNRKIAASQQQKPKGLLFTVFKNSPRLNRQRCTVVRKTKGGEMGGHGTDGTPN